jgi:hypothetical protein
MGEKDSFPAPKDSFSTSDDRRADSRTGLINAFTPADVLLAAEPPTRAETKADSATGGAKDTGDEAKREKEILKQVNDPDAIKIMSPERLSSAFLTARKHLAIDPRDKDWQPAADKIMDRFFERKGRKGLTTELPALMKASQDRLTMNEDPTPNYTPKFEGDLGAMTLFVNDKDSNKKEKLNYSYENKAYAAEMERQANKLLPYLKNGHFGEDDTERKQFVQKLRGSIDAEKEGAVIEKANELAKVARNLGLRFEKVGANDDGLIHLAIGDDKKEGAKTKHITIDRDGKIIDWSN